jgi:hypothetical protein
MHEPTELTSRRRWFLVHAVAVIAWVAGLGASVATGIEVLGIGGWAALVVAGAAGLRGGVSLLAPRRTAALVEADPAIRVDGYTASGPVSLILWLAIILGLAGAIWATVQTMALG